MSGTLVLNATYEPLCVVPNRRAVVLLLAEKAVLVEAAGSDMHSERLTIVVPSVVKLSRFVRVPYRARVPLSRRGVLVRDGGRCAYCGRRADTVDHVVPRSRGGEHAWENVVAACAACNHRKADRLLVELGWTLPFRPTQPVAAAVMGGLAQHQAAWEPYLAAWAPRREAS